MYHILLHQSSRVNQGTNPLPWQSWWSFHPQHPVSFCRNPSPEPVDDTIYVILVYTRCLMMMPNPMYNIYIYGVISPKQQPWNNIPHHFWGQRSAFKSSEASRHRWSLHISRTCAHHVWAMYACSFLALFLIGSLHVWQLLHHILKKTEVCISPCIVGCQPAIHLAKLRDPSMQH